MDTVYKRVMLLWQIPNIPFTLIALCISSIAVLTSAHFWKKVKHLEAYNDKITQEVNQKKPKKWVKVGTVKQLIIYPIKSCAGMFLDKAILTTLGLKSKNSNVQDRQFVIINENGKVLSMTNFPKLAFVKPTICKENSNSITVNAPDMPSLTFTFPEPDGKNERLCRLSHDKHLKALDCGDDVAQWFSEYVQDSTIRVCFHNLKKSQRTPQPYFTKSLQFEQCDMGSFQGKTSFLIISEESISEINKLLEKESSWKNWRPTILIDQVSEPFAEVNWSYVRIGNGILKGSFPCRRCPLTTVDNDLGILTEDGEPLKTLREMKIEHRISETDWKEICKEKPVMGLCLGLYQPNGEGAVISNGDSIYAALL